jgi:hypothetical protein
MAGTPQITPPPSPTSAPAQRSHHHAHSKLPPQIPNYKPKLYKKHYYLPALQAYSRSRLCYELQPGKKPPPGAIEIVIKVPEEYSHMRWPEALKLLDAEGGQELGKETLRSAEEVRKQKSTDEFDISMLDWRDIRGIEDCLEVGEWGLGNRDVWDQHAVRAWRKFVGSKEQGWDVWGTGRKEGEFGLLSGEGVWSPRGSFYGDRSLFLSTVPVQTSPAPEPEDGFQLDRVPTTQMEIMG